MTDIAEAARAEGRCWLFVDANINSDLLMPGAAFRLRTEEEQSRLVLKPYRPGWVDEVQEGDIIVGGQNFGTGSGRPWARLLYLLGVRALVAESINDLAYRNCVNAALPAMEVPGISTAIAEGERLRVDIREGIVTVLESGQVLNGTPMPDQLLEIVAAGGLVEQLTAAGYIG
jgi:3-isopropylmalate/(R)-2-methylmalate dehydratase small subunit